MTAAGITALIEEQEHIIAPARSDIERIQLEKLNKVLKLEKRRGGFYKDLPEKLDKLSDLACLPFTSEKDLAENPFAFLLSSQADIKRIISGSTSGTTGLEKRVFYTEKDCENTVRLFMAGLAELVYPKSTTMICMPFSGPFGLGELIAEAIERLGAKPLRVGMGRSYSEMKEIMEKEKPDTFVGMPVQLLSMLRYCGKGSIERALISADACAQAVKEGIETILGTELFPHYGSREMALGGAICCRAHEGMHLRENHVIAEIVDRSGKPLEKGEYGELVITTIGMEAMPLIRYKTGDYTRIIPEKCPCGCQAVRLDEISRQTNKGILKSDELLFRIPTVVDYKIEMRGDIPCFTIICKSLENSDRITNALPINAKVNLHLAVDSDKPMYLGKRTVLKSKE